MELKNYNSPHYASLCKRQSYEPISKCFAFLEIQTSDQDDNFIGRKTEAFLPIDLTEFLKYIRKFS